MTTPISPAPAADAPDRNDPRRGHLAELLAATVAKVPQATVLIAGEDRMTYRELDDAVAWAAAWLRHQGVGEGDRVALMAPNVPLFPVVAYAVARIGAVLVPLNPLFTGREIDYFLEDSGARVLWAMPGNSAAQETAANRGATFTSASPAEVRAEAEAAGLAPVTAVTPRTPDDDDAVLVYTSGTTGRPKGARLSHANLCSNAITTASTLSKLTPEDVVFAALPLFHVFGLAIVLHGTVSAGGCMSLIARFDPPAAAEQIVRDGVTVLPGVPTIFGALLGVQRARRKAGQEPLAFPSVRFALSGGASLPVEVLHAAEALLGTPVREGYGLTENSGACAFNSPERPSRPGTVGVPLEGFEIRLVAPDGTPVPEEDHAAVGELCIRGEGVMAGYWNKPEATAAAFDEEGWFRSGDLARRDEAGHLEIVDRIKDVIIRGGMNVYPREVEEVLYEHPDVTEVAVVGVPDERLGEEVNAFVSLAPGASVAEDELIAFAAERLAPYKRPRRVTVLDGLPKNATGKILRRELRG